MRRVLQVSKRSNVCTRRLIFSFRSELTEPQKLLAYLLQPSIANLAPDIIAVYIHTATKVFGYWAAEIAQRWDDDLLPDVTSVVDMVIERVSDFISSPHIEVQERASNLSHKTMLWLYPLTISVLGGKHTTAVHIRSERP